MNWSGFEDWLRATNVLTIGLVVFASMCLAGALGTAIRVKRDKRKGEAGEFDTQEGYVVSAVLGLLALLLGFTFSLAVDRFDSRRLLVLDEAKAIATTYLRAQLLTEPHRARMSDLLIRYSDNRIALAKAKPHEDSSSLANNEALITDIWVATIAAFDSIKDYDFSSAFLDSVNNVIELDAARKAARRSRIPSEVFVVLFVNLVIGASVLGYVLRRPRGRISAAFLLFLFTLALMLIVDIDRPTLGGIVEDQTPMEEMRRSIGVRAPATLDRLRSANYGPSQTTEPPPRKLKKRASN